MRKLILIILLLAGLSSVAQNIGVKSFRALPSDMTAASRDGKRIDQNGEVAALIKVVTTQQGFIFEGGSLGIVDTKQEYGEIWVWVPHGLRKVTIKHQQLGVLRDYYFPIEIEAERTYEMVLVTGRVETMVSPVVTQQFLVFNVTPKDAKVTVDGQPWPVRAGVASKLVDFGQHDYAVEAPDHHADAGKVTVNDPDNKVVVDVNLRKAYGFVKIEGDKELLRQASIYIDNATAADALDNPKKVSGGKHRVQVVHSMYKPFDQPFEVADGETYTVHVDLASNFADLTLTVDGDAELWVDGERKGTGKWTGPLLEGRHTVVCRKKDCRESTEVINVNSAMNGQTITLKTPTPYTGRLVVNSTPAMAKLFIDDKDMNETPIQINEIVVGKHALRLEKEGYLTLHKDIVIEDGKTLSLDLEMEERPVQKEKPVEPKPQREPRTDVAGQAFFATANVAYNPITPSYGFAVGSLGKLGWFVTAMSNFGFAAWKYDAVADAEGLIDGERPNYADGFTSLRLSVLGGLTMRLATPLYVRVGAGYGMQVLNCQTTSGVPVRWSQGSAQGVEVTAGLQLKVNKFTASLDAVSTNFKTVEAKVGVGMTF